MSETTAPLGIVVAHSDLARALIAAVERIAGPSEGALVPLSNDGLGPDDIRERLATAIGDAPAVVFTDLREGSCGMAARRVCLGHVDRFLVTGVNLPVLLDFVMNRHLPLAQIADRVVDRGRRSIEAMPEPKTA